MRQQAVIVGKVIKSMFAAIHYRVTDGDRNLCVDRHVRHDSLVRYRHGFIKMSDAAEATNNVTNNNVE